MEKERKAVYLFVERGGRFPQSDGWCWRGREEIQTLH